MYNIFSANTVTRSKALRGDPTKGATVDHTKIIRKSRTDDQRQTTTVEHTTKLLETVALMTNQRNTVEQTTKHSLGNSN